MKCSMVVINEYEDTEEVTDDSTLHFTVAANTDSDDNGLHDSFNNSLKKE